MRLSAAWAAPCPAKRTRGSWKIGNMWSGGDWPSCCWRRANRRRTVSALLDSFQAAKQFGLVTNLAAWAAASIELQGADAVSFIQRCYFCDPDRKRDELVEVVKAMSLHGTEGRTELRDQIVSSYDVLLDVHPQMMEYIVKDLIAWKRFELKQRISNIEAKGAKLDFAAKKAIRQYLGSTESGQ